MQLTKPLQAIRIFNETDSKESQFGMIHKYMHRENGESGYGGKHKKSDKGDKMEYINEHLL